MTSAHMSSPKVRAISELFIQSDRNTAGTMEPPYWEGQCGAELRFRVDRNRQSSRQDRMNSSARHRSPTRSSIYDGTFINRTSLGFSLSINYLLFIIILNKGCKHVKRCIFRTLNAPTTVVELLLFHN